VSFLSTRWTASSTASRSVPSLTTSVRKKSIPSPNRSQGTWNLGKKATPASKSRLLRRIEPEAASSVAVKRMPRSSGPAMVPNRDPLQRAARGGGGHPDHVAGLDVFQPRPFEDALPRA